MEEAVHNYQRKIDGKFAEAERLAALPPEARQLYRQLSLLRWRLARDAGIPAFYILGNQTLLAICEKMPLDGESLARIPGFGAQRFRTYGAEFLAILKQSTH